MKQIVVINGGTCYDSYQEYLESMKSLKVDVSAFKPKIDWKNRLQEVLGNDFDVFLPLMPNKNNANYEEWKIWFEKIYSFLDNNVILLGHSLGGIFLVKYLSENKFTVVIKKLLLVALPFDSGPGGSIGNFKLGKDFKLLKDQVKDVSIYFSRDDKVVPFSHAQKYKEILPEAKIVVFEDRGHFSKTTEFPELVDEIKK